MKHGVSNGLQQRGYQVSNRQGDIDMQVNIKLAYLRPLPLRLHATVALEVELQSDQQRVFKQSFRAIGDRVNWANGKSEIMDALNTALNNVVANIAEDILPPCLRSARGR